MSIRALRRGIISQRPFPNEIAGMLLWFKAGDLALADGAAVATWTDRSGNARDATQATGAAQPAFVASDPNSRPCVSFDGGDNLVTAAFAIPSSFSVISVAKVTGGTYPQGIVNSDLSGSSATRLFQHRFGSATTAESIGYNTTGTSGLDVSPALDATAWSITTTRRSSSGNVEAFANGAGNGSTAVGTANSGTLPVMLGAAIRTPAVFLTGRIAEVLMYDTALSTSDRKAVEGYLATQYALTVS